MSPHRLALGALAAAAALIALPVLTPVWAAPRPVPSTVRIVPVSGVDEVAWRATPAALDPAAVDRDHRGAPGVAGAAGAATDGPRAAPPTAARVSGSKRPALLSAELDQRPFRVSGVQLPAGVDSDDVVVQVRVREQAGGTGRWTDWQPLDFHDGAEPGSKDTARAGDTRATEPLTSSLATGIQVRVDSLGGRAVPGASLLLIDPGRAPADDLAATTPAGRATASTTAPPIITRAQWGADETLRPCGEPTFVPTIKVGFVHHTASTNTYSPADSAGLVRGIYAYHVTGNGWCDIGYNLLVDKYGQIFEGRYGGVHLAVQGAHTGGFNYDSFGVSSIGNYDTVAPPSALLTSVGKVLGWKLGLHGRDPLGYATLTSAGNGKYPQGQAVTFSIVSGHRDAGLTDCPGARLYAQLSTLRLQANAYRLANTVRDEDLYGALLTDPTLTHIQLRAAGAGTAYQKRLLDVVTTWTKKAPEDWQVFIGSFSGDTRPDLIALHLRNTASTQVEIRVSTWASGYQDTPLLDVPLPFGEQAPDGPVRFAVGGPSGGDLYAILTRTGASGQVEVHALSPLSAYSTWSWHSASALPVGDYPASTTELLAGRNGDLFLVLHGRTGSGRSEVHRLGAASRYTSWTLHRALPIGYTEDRWAQWRLGTALTDPDLFLVLTSQTGSGRQEVHRVSAASGWSAFALQVATDLPTATHPTWQVGLG